LLGSGPREGGWRGLTAVTIRQDSLEVRMMRRMCNVYPLAILTFASVWVPSAAHAQLWKHLMPVKRVESDPGGDYTLNETDGPWLVMAATFSGEGAEEQAGRLVLEFRQRYNLPAYVHEVTFNYSADSPGRGLDQYGAPIRRHYQVGDHVREYAVLVGDFPAIDDPDAQKLLERVKGMQPAALAVGDGQKTAQNLAQFRQLQAKMLEKLGKKGPRGPMAQAFMVRNPLLPREYFVPRGVDSFVARMNSGVEHSLLDCPGRYTVQVATFRGKTVLQTSDTENQSSSGSFWHLGRDQDDPLVEAAENAHLLTQELRAHGWEAYEFHNRTESIVTIGSFDEVAQRLADGRVVPTPLVQKIIRTFGAAYDTPADPLTNIGNDPTTQRLVAQRKREFNQMITNRQGQIVAGLNPKHVKIFHGRHLERIIPMDIYPHTIEVPRRSVSSAYVGVSTR
jgi:hypothetical protein